MRIRLTTRRWVATVAVVAVILGIVVETARLRRLARVYRQRAETYAALRRQETPLLRSLEEFSETTRTYEAIDARFARLNKETLATVERVRRRLADFERREEKYRRAAARPWESLAPDPPEPP